jgi:ribosomal protein S18 acetylase RimI-like enzyme
MTVRRPTPDDARPIAELHVRSWRAAYRGLLPDELLDRLSVDEREGKWRELIASSGAAVVVAELDGRLAGFCVTAPSGDEAELTALYVEPERWRTGIGGRLLRAAIDDLRAGGCRALTLWVLPANASAIAFYERFGFEHDGGEKIEEGTGARCVRMRAALAVE